MNPADSNLEFPRGLLRPELFIGVVSSVTASSVGVNLSEAGKPSGSQFEGGRYGRGEVGEFVLIEGQQALLLGRLAEVALRDAERRGIGAGFAGDSGLQALGRIQLLGSVAMDDLVVSAGVESYPRIGDRIYSAPHRFLAMLPRLMEGGDGDSGDVLLELGVVDAAHESRIAIKPERLFGRHCAILGATGGGKSWTTARIIEECLRYSAKLILIDATGEYRGLSGTGVSHCHLDQPSALGPSSTPVSLPPASFLESDFLAIFEPAGKVQGPKLRAAIRSLRLARIRPDLAPNGYVKKINQPKVDVEAAENDPAVSARLEDPRQPFDVRSLVKQIEQECVWPDDLRDRSKWGKEDGNFSHCLSLVARINGVLTSRAFSCVFSDADRASLADRIDEFVGNKSAKLLRICLGSVAYEFRAREIIANALGRQMLALARGGQFRQRPTAIILDEAHHFLGRSIGGEDYAAKLDAFELIAKEGRKYGLNIILASQRPRDITEGVLSQMGTLIVHRLTNDRDREVVERACGEIDRGAAAFLPNLRPGEAAIIGTDFPIPLSIQIREPSMKPESSGPDFQKFWRNPPESGSVTKQVGNAESDEP